MFITDLKPLKFAAGGKNLLEPGENSIPFLNLKRA
jgi:hypothetical protein